MLFVEQISLLNFVITWTAFGPFTFYSLLRFIYVVFLLPYLQGVSILYIYHYSKKRKPKLSAMFGVAFTRLCELVLGHFLVLFRLGMVSIIAVLLVTTVGTLLMFTTPP